MKNLTAFAGLTGRVKGFNYPQIVSSSKSSLPSGFGLDLHDPLAPVLSCIDWK
jgi:hypothetical protein